VKSKGPEIFYASFYENTRPGALAPHLGAEEPNEHRWRNLIPLSRHPSLFGTRGYDMPLIFISADLS
jgi:hypothetical protein